MLCEQNPNLEVIKAYINPVVFLEEMPQLDFDLCIIDIEMPGMNGIQVAQALKGKPVIFTTAYKDYAADAFDVNAIDYVIKPIKKERLQQAVLKAMQQLPLEEKSKPYLAVNTSKGKTLLYMDQLLYVKIAETDSRDKQAYLADGSVLTIKNITFEKMQSILPPSLFCRVNKGELISLKAISTFTSSEILLNIRDKKGIPFKIQLSETYRSEFQGMIKL